MDLEKKIKNQQAQVDRHPEDINALTTLSNLLLTADRMEEAVTCLERAVRLQPNNHKTHYNLGVCYNKMKRVGDAQRAYFHSLQIQPSADAYLNLASTYHQTGDFIAATQLYEMGIAAFPKDGRLHANLGQTYKLHGETTRALRAYRNAIMIDDQQFLAHSNMLLTMHYLQNITNEAIYQESLRWAERYTRNIQPLTQHPNTPAPDRKLKIGYVSADFREHVVSRFITPILAAHDSEQVEVYAYSNHTHEDQITQQIKSSVAHWRNIAHDSDATAAQKIHADGIDILIELSGHSSGNRLLMMAHKPAPIQASWIGYFSTTGLQAIDYFIADAQVLPPEDEAFYVEKILRLPHLYCYRDNDHAIAVAPAPVEKNGYLTFGCFGNISKHTHEIRALWAEILKKVPDSRLLLKNTSFSFEHMREHYLEYFVTQGIAAERIIFDGPSSFAAYLEAHSRVDIMLDTFPYNAGATALDALWMGVPLITIQGERMMSRVAGTHEAMIGLEDFVASDAADYVAKAVALAEDPSQLIALRPQLRERLQRSGIMDAASYTKALEAAYRDIWKAWCRGQAH